MAVKNISSTVRISSPAWSSILVSLSSLCKLEYRRRCDSTQSPREKYSTTTSSFLWYFPAADALPAVTPYQGCRKEVEVEPLDSLVGKPFLPSFLFDKDDHRLVKFT